MIYFFILLLLAAALVLLVPKKKVPATSPRSSIVLANPEPKRPPTEQEAIAAVFVVDAYLESIGKSDVDRSTLRHQVLLELHGEEA